ncbi:amyloid fiber anchoring/assembly protein TapA [Alkalibacillus almallahensis]|uniref:amyloid fiber anchoring/assembly protein TapA n=1 Tax=Alkalibacillus almallahensis TaxID=1379154 RepID=UPI00141E4208|nr:amyloid fiber anchoring/assembly protein TapA [Alkalibacillus almallahensis]
MRQRRLTKKRRRQMKRNLYIKPLVTVYIAFLLLALTVDGTAAKFNDITSVEGAFQVGEWTPDIPDDDEDEEEEGWDKSSLTFTGGVHGGCEQIIATIKNSGEDMTSPWEYHVYRAANLKGKPEWQRVSDFEGETELLGKGESDELTFNPDNNGRYYFKFVRQDGHPGGDNGGKSEAIKLKDCEEKQSANSEGHNGKKNNQDERHKDKKENNKGNGKKGKDNNSEQNQNKKSSNQENNEELEEDKEIKQDNGNNQENEQKSEQNSKDQESKDEAAKEKSEDAAKDSPDDKKDQKKKQPSTKNEQQQDSKQEKETAETNSTDDRQQDDQTTKSQNSKDDDTQVKEDESSKGAQNEKE